MRVYDQDKDGALSKEEFLEAILPSRSQALRKMAANRKKQQIKPKQKLPYQTEYAISKVIEQEVGLQKALDYHRADLAERWLLSRG